MAMTVLPQILLDSVGCTMFKKKKRKKITVLLLIITNNDDDNDDDEWIKSYSCSQEQHFVFLDKINL